MSLIECLVSLLIVSAGLVGAAALAAGASAQRRAAGQDLAGTLAVSGFLDEALGDPGRVEPFRGVRVARFRWMERCVAPPGAAPGPRVSRDLPGGRVRVTARFDDGRAVSADVSEVPVVRRAVLRERT